MLKVSIPHCSREYRGTVPVSDLAVIVVFVQRAYSTYSQMRTVRVAVVRETV